MSIVIYTNKDFHSVDSVSIKCSKIPGTSMFTTDDSTPKKSTILFDCKVLKEQTPQSISQDLLDSSFVATRFVYDLIVEDDY